MQQTVRFQIPIPTSLYTELKHQSIDERVSVMKYVQSDIDIFVAKLVERVQTTKSIKNKQYEDSKAITENPLEVTGLKVEPITEIETIHKSVPFEVTGKEIEDPTTKSEHIDSL